MPCVMAITAKMASKTVHRWLPDSAAISAQAAWNTRPVHRSFMATPNVTLVVAPFEHTFDTPANPNRRLGVQKELPKCMIGQKYVWSELCEQ